MSNPINKTEVVWKAESIQEDIVLYIIRLWDSFSDDDILSSGEVTYCILTVQNHFREEQTNERQRHIRYVVAFLFLF
jgi:hypothetical protein